MWFECSVNRFESCFELTFGQKMTCGHSTESDKQCFSLFRFRSANFFTVVAKGLCHLLGVPDFTAFSRLNVAQEQWATAIYASLVIRYL